MPRLIESELVEPVVRALLGAIDTGDGGTDEQRRVLAAFVTGYWGRADLDPTTLGSTEPEQAAVEITGPGPRRRTRELMVLLELCRHPLTDAQVTRTDAYAAALDETGPGLELARELVRDGAEVAMADYLRRTEKVYGELSEPSLRAAYDHDLAEPDPTLVARLRSMGDFPPGTLGHEYFTFIDRHGFQFPGETTLAPAVFVAHDMCHVITGYGTTGEEEIAVNAMQVALATAMRTGSSSSEASRSTKPGSSAATDSSPRPRRSTTTVRRSSWPRRSCEASSAPATTPPPTTSHSPTNRSRTSAPGSASRPARA